MLKAWIYNKGGCTDTISFDVSQVETFIVTTSREYPFDSTILITMRTGVQHLIANRDSIGDTIFNALKPKTVKQAFWGMDPHDFVALIVQDVCELPDRSSPEEWPEAMIVTSEELARIILNRIGVEL